MNNLIYSCLFLSYYFGLCYGKCVLNCDGPHEEVRCVPECPPQKTCKNRDIQFNCLEESTQKYHKKCVCKYGYYRNAIGECITEEECDRCPKDHEFFSCGSACDNTCADPTQNRTTCRIINITCNKKCYCEDGYARDENDNCIPKDECPLQCNKPHESPRWVSECPPEKTCKNRLAKFRCKEGYSYEKKQLKCVCDEGYYRNAIGECITKEECERCTKDFEFFSCGSECDNTCATLDTQNRTNCPMINVKCNPMCYCEDGYARDDDGECIPVQQCTKSCKGPHEYYQKCKKTCPPDTCISLVAKFKCDPNPPCKPGCVCQSNFLRAEIGKPCMPISQCPQLANSDDFS